MLDLHFITGDGRGNENIALTSMHTIFHAEHNRLVGDVDRLVNTPGFLSAAEVAAWHSVHSGSGWGYGERLFQAARFVTEMQYQHLVFEEFGRKVQPQIHPFTVYQTSINPAISAEFAHTVYRLGHSMLPEVLGRINTNGTTNDIRLLAAFLNPAAFNDGGAAGPLTAAQAVGSLARGLSKQVGNELDEFVTSSVRNTLVGLPLDLPAINIARGRSEGIPSLNSARRQFFAATRDATVAPYANWFEFGLNLKHRDSLVNFVAAYGTDPSITGATTLVGKRAAALTLVSANGAFMFQSAATSGLDNVDFWPGGMAERQTVFGGLLGTTFNFVFEKQLESLQDADRFYYLQRTDGLNLRTQLEGNSFNELIRRNTDFAGGMTVVFATADFNFDAASLTGTAPVDLSIADPTCTGCQLLTLVDGTKVFFDPLHRGKNVVFNGGPGDDRFRGDVGDDTAYGNAGNDRLEGGDGNDTLVGGDGDDILFGGNGNDVLKGGPGNDALNGGPGFGGDIMMGGDGNDFLVGGDNINEFFAGPGDDIIVDGNANTEGMVGGPGDDWLEGGDGHDANMFGDDGNFFDLLAGLSAVGGDDVLNGEAGQDNHFGEGGDDIFIMNEGTENFFGDFGFDWVTMRGFPTAADIELDLIALPAAPVNFNDTRNKYRYVDGASGWNFNDHIRGDSRVNTVGAPPELAFLPGMELNAGTAPVGDVGGSGAAKIAGLTDLMVIGFGQTFPFNAGNILLGGLGSDLIEGKGGDDLIDGDRWLNVQLKATYNPGTVNPDGTVNGGTVNPDGTISNGTVKLVDFARSLIDDVFADPQRLNPGNIHIVRTIVTPVVGPADCRAAVPLNCDTAVFSGPRAQYTITSVPTAFGTRVTVTDNGTTAGIVGPGSNGTDTLLNIELLAFADGTIIAPGVVFSVPVPNVVNLTQAAATTAITGAFLTVGGVTTASSTTVAAGSIISESPAAGTSVPSGSAVALVVSSGLPLLAVPNVVGSTQAAATTAITGAGLTVGAITTANSTTVPAGNVISQSPASGLSVATGSAVNFVVSLGTNAAPVLTATVLRNSQGTALLRSPALTSVANSLLVAFVAADADPAGPNATVIGVTNNGVVPLTWTRAVGTTAASQLGMAEIWWAYSTSAQSLINVSATLSSVKASSMTVMAFTGADPALIGAGRTVASALSGAPSASIVTTRGNSLVFGVGNDFSNGRTMVAGAGQTKINQFVPATNDTYWLQRVTGPVAAAGSTATISDTYAGAMADQWNLVVIEIRHP